MVIIIVEETRKLRVEVAREMFFNESYGVYALYPLEKGHGIKLNNYHNFVASGDTFQLIEGAEYDIEIKEKEDKKYGRGWGFVNVTQDRPVSVAQQQAYVKALIAESYSKALLNHYPTEKILDLFKEDKIDFKNIKGIGEVRYKEIKETLLNNLDIQEAISELSDLQISFGKMKKLVEHFGSPHIVVEKVKNNIYKLCEVDSFGFKTVDGFALNRGDDKRNKNRIIASLIYILKEEEQSGNSWSAKFTTVEKMRELLGIERKTIETVLKNIPSSVYSDEDRFALKRTYSVEKNIKLKLQKLLESETNIKLSNSSELIAQVEDKQGFKFSEEQLQAINLAIDNNVLIINGKAGTGKTTTLKGILALMDRFNHVACALSGKASKIMSKNGLNSKTIHRLLEWKGKQFTYNKEHPLVEPIIVVDETSMINSHLFYSLVQAIRNGSKLIILGDSGQLAGIGVGAVFRDLVGSNFIPKIELTKVQRQAEKSGILLAANEIRDGNQIISSGDYQRKIIGELKDFVLFPVEDKGGIRRLTEQVAQKFKDKDLFEFQIITGRKSGGDISVKELNNGLQPIYNQKTGESVKSKGYEYFVGDKIIQCGNNYDADGGKLSIFNGTLGKILSIHKDVPSKTKNIKETLIEIEFEDIKNPITYKLEDMSMIELAYAISCHRSQGSTIKHVLFVFDYSSYMLLSKQFVYTGITRSSEGCVTIAEAGALRHAIKTDVSESRRTFLREFLNTENL